jgi:hypothetical protein
VVQQKDSVRVAKSVNVCKTLEYFTFGLEKSSLLTLGILNCARDKQYPLLLRLMSSISITQGPGLVFAVKKQFMAMGSV